MKHFVFLWATCLCISASVIAGDGRILTHRRPVPDSYIVVLHPMPIADVPLVARALAAQFGVQLSKRNNDGADSIFLHAFQGFSGRMTSSSAEALAADPRVMLVEQNAYFELSTTRQTFTEADPHFNLDRVDQRGVVTAGNRSYTYSTTGAGVYIFVVDTGVQRNHREFDNDFDPNTPQMNPRVLDGVRFASDGWPAYNPCGGYVAGYPAGTHGTAVASVAAGRFVGVAKSAYVVPVRVVNCNGTGMLEWWCWGMDWIAGPENTSKRPAVANVSLFIDSADPWDTTTPISSLEHTMNNVNGAGIAVVVSANNQANSHCTTSPARMAYGNAGNYTPSPYHVISVGGTDEYDRLWRCLNFGDCNNVTEDDPDGTDPGSNTGPCVDLYAPAHNLKVAWNSSYSAYRQLASQRSGTSFASPLVAGVAARLLQTNPNMTPQMVWDAIRTRATPFPSNFDGDGIPANDRIAFINPLE